MATHWNIPVGKIPGTGEPGGLHSMRSQRIGHDSGTKWIIQVKLSFYYH